MQFQIASVLAFAATAAATYSNVTYTTEVVTELVTYCPEATTITYGSETYTVTEPTTLTITNCPCTISKPVYVTSSVECNTCAAPTSYPVYSNTTTAGPEPTYPAGPVGTGTGAPSAPISTPTEGPGFTSNGVSNAIALSGASLAGLLGLAAFIL